MHEDNVFGKFLAEETENAEEANDLAEEHAGDILETRPCICDDIDGNSHHR